MSESMIPRSKSANAETPQPQSELEQLRAEVRELRSLISGGAADETVALLRKIALQNDPALQRQRAKDAISARSEKQEAQRLDGEMQLATGDRHFIVGLAGGPPPLVRVVGITREQDELHAIKKYNEFVGITAILEPARIKHFTRELRPQEVETEIERLNLAQPKDRAARGRELLPPAPNPAPMYPVTAV